MTTTQKPIWSLRLSAIAEKADADKLSAWAAAGEVREAYADFLRSTYANPKRWIEEEKRIWYNATPRLVCPAAELIWWANSLKAKGGKRTAFFLSEELRTAIGAIHQAYKRELRRKYGPPAWRWEP